VLIVDFISNTYAALGFPSSVSGHLLGSRVPAFDAHQIL
jgi:hypothetical protein